MKIKKFEVEKIGHQTIVHKNIEYNNINEMMRILLPRLKVNVANIHIVDIDTKEILKKYYNVGFYQWKENN